MRNKKLLISTAVIIVAIAVFLIVDGISTFGGGEGGLFFPNLSESNVSTVVVRNGFGGKVRLENTPDGWVFIDESEQRETGQDESGRDENDSPASDVRTPANERLVTVAFDIVRSIRKNNLVSNNAANHAAFGVDHDGDGGPTVEFFTDGDEPAYAIIFGRQGQSWREDYVRLRGSDEVFLVHGDLKEAFVQAPDYWLPPPPPEEPAAGPEELFESEAAADTSEL